jgi:hypothetical protein
MESTRPPRSGTDRKVKPHQIIHSGQTVTRFGSVAPTYIGTASGGNPAVQSPLTPLAVPLLVSSPDSLRAATTRAGYAATLARLTAVSGPHHPVAALEPEHYAAVTDCWNTAAAAT